MDQALGTSIEMKRCLAPFGHGLVAQRTVARHEIEGGFTELVAEVFKAIGKIAKAGVRDEAGDASQEREARTFDRGLHPGFDQGEGRERVARDEAFVTKLNESVGDV